MGLSIISKQAPEDTAGKFCWAEHIYITHIKTYINTILKYFTTDADTGIQCACSLMCAFLRKK